MQVASVSASLRQGITTDNSIWSSAVAWTTNDSISLIDRSGFSVSDVGRGAACGGPTETWLGSDWAARFQFVIMGVLVLSLVVLFGVFVARVTHDHIVTPQRVELMWGIIGRNSKEARICDIRSIDVYESGIKGMLGIGTIDFSTAANAGIEVQFKDMRQAHEVKDLVRKLQKGVDPTED